MHPSPHRYALPASFLILLAACGGGGGGGGGGGPTDVAFQSFDTIRANQRANMTGISQTASGTGTSGADGSFAVSSVAIAPTVDTANSRAQITFDGNRNISAFSFTAPQSSVSFPSGVDCSVGAVCAAETATSAGVLGNPSNFAWNYQTYGVWFNLPSPTTFQAGAMSMGAATPGTAIPPTGDATFTGFTSGFYVNEIGVPHFLSANVGATVNWSTQSIAFSTNSTTIGNLNTGSVTADSLLNLNGTLTYAPGSNQFTSSTPLTALRNSLTGSATGRFYGPAAQEMGGVYNLSGTGGSSLIGAFGARRP